MKLSLAILLLIVPAAADAEGWLNDLAAAKKAAAAQNKPVLVDFQAVWCYSCYYMEEKVLSKSGFKNAAAGLVLLKLDVDTEEGLALKKKLKVTFLPSYVLMDASERELGRIIGEQTEADFLAQLTSLAGGAVKTPAQRLSAALDADELMAAGRLRAELLKAVDAPSGPEWDRAAGRLDLALALKSGKDLDTVVAFTALMRLGGGCELPYHLFRAEKALAGVSTERRKAALEAARKVLGELLESRFFGPEPARCADGRSVVEGAAQALEGLGLTAERQALVERVADELGRRVKAVGVGSDRNLDDDYRVALAAAGRREPLLEHLAALAKAYPSDYVYPYRLAKVLVEAGRPKDALALSETAYHLSYGANRFGTARLRAELLAGAGRPDEARALLRLELKAAKAHFPDQAASLEQSLKKLGG